MEPKIVPGAAFRDGWLSRRAEQQEYDDPPRHIVIDDLTLVIAPLSKASISQRQLQLRPPI